MKRRVTVAAVLVTLTGLTAYAMYGRRGPADPEIATDVVSRGSIVNVVSASGTLEAVETVQVGTQVSGSVKSLYADFNSIVRKGQVLARLDPALIVADINRAQANLQGAQADRERLTVLLNDAKTKEQRAQELSNRQLIAASDLESAVMARKTAEAQLRAADAQVTQAGAALSQAQVNLQKTVITSPIDGIVISRDVDVGQTVAASLQAPTLFTIAADLGEMQLKASIDESDVGGIHPGQPVTFRVDAYPNDVFRGQVTQVRLNPVVEQNVVTYAAIVSAPNPDLKLKPGMTASLSVEVVRREGVLRVPAAALRFKPSAEVLGALGRDPQGAAGPPAANRPVGTSGRPAASLNQATIWIYESDTLRPMTVKTGITDGAFTELLQGPAEGTRIATRVSAPAAAAPSTPSSGSSNPLLGPTPPRRF
jgi:HlyD family secretion protein